MIFYTDEKDLRYVFSGFDSAKELFGYLKNINHLIENKKYQELSKYIEYPVFDINKNRHIGEDAFIQFADEIITKKVEILLKKAEDGSNFTLLNKGIMLNSRGDVWLASYVDKGILIRINDPL